YGAFSRRESGVALLQVRAGNPPRATNMLIRYHRIEESRYRLTELWRTWEVWFADIEETHTTFPILAFFRSPQPERSWITSAGRPPRRGQLLGRVHRPSQGPGRPAVYSGRNPGVAAHRRRLPGAVPS